MLLNKQLLVVGNFKLQYHHLLVIGILAISFSISFMIRSQAADYGFELNEFDPFFNLRATQFIVDNGIAEYFEWNDDKSWHTIDGRNVSATSQVMLHVTAAVLYQIFGGGLSLYDFTILFPVIFGSFTCIVIFAMVRVIGGTGAGLLAALFFSVSVPIIVRGTIGWFKSEPLGLFYGILGLYLFLSGIKSKNKKIAAMKLIGGGLFLGLGLSAWGGIEFFAIPLGLFFLALPFVRRDSNFIIWAVPLFSSTFLLTSLIFERTGLRFITSVEGAVILGPTIIMVVILLIQKFSLENHKIRNGLLFLFASLILGTLIIVYNPETDDTGKHHLLPLPSFRYLNAINPFLTTSDPLVDSVSEHATLTIESSFRWSSVLMIFAGIGVWLSFRYNEKKNGFKFLENDMKIFALIIGILGVYISSSFLRLELFASISLILLSSIGLSIITKEIFTRKLSSKKNKKILLDTSLHKISKISYVIIIIVLLLVPLTLPPNQTWVNAVKGPPTILNGGSHFNVAMQDWPDAMNWLKNDTPEDSIVASWWDYGYWITTLGERTSIADNATLSTKVIQKMAQMFLSTPDDAWLMLNEMDADYVLVYVVGQKVPSDGDIPLYLLGGGGDENKMQWFMRIAGVPTGLFLLPDNKHGNDFFWDNTVLGKMFPFSSVVFYNPNNSLQSETYRHGYVPIYEKDIKFPSDGNGPLKLAYESDSLNRKSVGVISGIIIYEVNKDYKLSEP